MPETHNMTAIPLHALLGQMQSARDRQHGGRVERALYPLIIGRCTAVHRTQLEDSSTLICSSSREVLESKSAMHLPGEHLVSFGTTSLPNQRSMGGDGKRSAASGHQPMKKSEESHSPIDLRGPECAFLCERWQQQQIVAAQNNRVQGAMRSRPGCFVPSGSCSTRGPMAICHAQERATTSHHPHWRSPRQSHGRL